MAVDIIDLAGDAQTRGEAYGAAKRKQIDACITDWLGSLRATGIAEPQNYIAQMLRDTDFLTAIRQHCPDILDEVSGIAAGAEQPFDLLLGAQLMDEEWAYRTSRTASAAKLEKCSSVAAKTKSDAVLIGQNMDLGGYTDGHQILFQVAPNKSEPGALIFSITSMIALFGVNTQRLGVCVNSIPQLPAARQGLPVAFVIRKLLQSRTLAEAVRTVGEVPHATGQHYLIADSTEIRSFEASPEGVTEFISPDPSGVFHTNHPLAEPLAKRFASTDNSLARLKSLRNRLATGHPDVEAIKATLASSDDPEHPVSRVGGASGKKNPLTGMTSFTTGSMISVLNARSNKIDAWVSPGPPSIHGYEPVSLLCANGSA